MWEIPTLGGAPRRLVDSIGGGDVGKDGRLTCFRLNGSRTELISTSRDGGEIQVIAEMTDPGTTAIHAGRPTAGTSPTRPATAFAGTCLSGRPLAVPRVS